MFLTAKVLSSSTAFLIFLTTSARARIVRVDFSCRCRLHWHCSRYKAVWHCSMRFTCSKRPYSSGNLIRCVTAEFQHSCIIVDIHDQLCKFLKLLIIKLDSLLVQVLHDRGYSAVHGALFVDKEKRQIGRASCRERV